MAGINEKNLSVGSTQDVIRTYAKIAKKLNLSNRQDAIAQRLVREERREFVECA